MPTPVLTCGHEKKLPKNPMVRPMETAVVCPGVPAQGCLQRRGLGAPTATSQGGRCSCWCRDMECVEEKVLVVQSLWFGEMGRW